MKKFKKEELDGVAVEGEEMKEKGDPPPKETG